LFQIAGAAAGRTFSPFSSAASADEEEVMLGCVQRGNEWHWAYGKIHS